MLSIRLAPFTHGIHYGKKRFSKRSDSIIDPWWDNRVNSATDDTVRLQFSQMRGKHLLADERKFFLEDSKSIHSGMDIAHDDHFPLAPDDLEAPSYRTFDTFFIFLYLTCPYIKDMVYFY